MGHLYMASYSLCFQKLKRIVIYDDYSSDSDNAKVKDIHSSYSTDNLRQSILKDKFFDRQPWVLWAFFYAEILGKFRHQILPFEFSLSQPALPF